MELRLNDEPAAETDREILVFDTSPLTHFAGQNWLGVLKAVVGSRLALIPDVILDELQQIAATDSRVAAVLDAGSSIGNSSAALNWPRSRNSPLSS